MSQWMVAARVCMCAGTASGTIAVRAGRSCASMMPNSVNSSIITGSHTPSPVRAPGR